MLDRVLLRPFNSSGTARSLLGPGDAPVPRGCPQPAGSAVADTHTLTTTGPKAADDLFYFISAINYSINISITANQEKAEHSASVAPALMQQHMRDCVHLATTRPPVYYLLPDWEERTAAQCVVCVWWNEVASEGNEIILHLKWMGIITTNQTVESSSKEKGFFFLCVWFAPQKSHCTYAKVIYWETGSKWDEIGLEVKPNAMININPQDKGRAAEEIFENPITALVWLTTSEEKKHTNSFKWNTEGGKISIFRSLPHNINKGKDFSFHYYSLIFQP